MLTQTDVDEESWSRFHERRYFNALMHHFDCRDPDHPGCERCEETPDEKDDQP